MLPHEKLDVYRKALAFVGDASTSAARWDKRHAVADQFGRASDSLVLNLAEGARLRPGRAKLRTLEWEPKTSDDFQVGQLLVGQTIKVSTKIATKALR